MTSEEKAGPLRSWIVTPAAEELIHRVGSAVLREAIRKKYSLHFLHTVSSWGDVQRDTEMREAVKEEICSELYAYLLDREAQLEEVFKTEDEKWAPYLKRAFINHWIDKTRRRDVDGYRYLIKRTGDILREAKEFSTLVEKNQPTCFCLTPWEAWGPEPVRTVPPTEEDLQEIGFPQSLGAYPDYDHVNRKEILLGLASHFWKELTRIQGRPVWVSIRDFMEWIRRYVILNLPETMSSDTEGDVKEKRQGRNLETTMGDLERQELEEQCEKWAELFVGSLNDKERKAACLRYGAELNLERIALEMGYRGPSGPAYIVAGVERKLKAFMEGIPRSSSADSNEELSLVFLSRLMGILKKLLPAPS